MRFLNFLLYELGLRAILFTVIGTAALSSLYLLSIGAPAEQYAQAGVSFVQMFVGSGDQAQSRAGFSAGEIIASGAAVTFPLALASLLFLILLSLTSASLATSSTFLAKDHGHVKSGQIFKGFGFVSSFLSAIPVFVGFWFLGGIYGISPPFILIPILLVTIGGLGWDASRFLISEMRRQLDTTHTLVFGTLGPPVGRVFPLPGTLTGYLVNSCAPRFIPYIAGKVPAIIGSVTVAEMVFSFPGLGRTLLDALLTKNTDLLISAVFVLLAVNAVVTFIVKTVLFVLYPRWYEKAL